MSILSSRSISARLLFTLLTATANTCDQSAQNKIIPPSPRAAHLASSRSMLFEFDGENIVPNRLLNTQAELICKDVIGECHLPRPKDKEMHIVFRNYGQGMDWVYRLGNGSSEIMYFFNNDNYAWELAVDRQPIIDVSNGRMWSIDIQSGDPKDELRKALENSDMTLVSKLLNSIPSLANFQYDDGQTLLMLATYTPQLRPGHDRRLAQMAIEAGANVEAKDVNGNAALHYAVYHNKLEIAELLIASKAQVNAQNIYGNTPLHYAMKPVNEPLANCLAQHGANFSIKNGDGQTPISMSLGY